MGTYLTIVNGFCDFRPNYDFTKMIRSVVYAEMLIIYESTLR